MYAVRCMCIRMSEPVLSALGVVYFVKRKTGVELSTHLSDQNCYRNASYVVKHDCDIFEL